MIYEADLLRRSGDPVLALQYLKEIGIPSSPIARQEFFIASAHAYFIKWKTFSSDIHDVEEALKVLETAIQEADQYQNILPNDRRSYALEGYVGICLQAKLFSRIGSHLDTYESYVEAWEDTPSKQRARGQIQAFRAKAAANEGDYLKATRHAEEYFHLGSGPYYRFDAAIEYLKAAIMIDGTSSLTNKIEEMVDYLIEFGKRGPSEEIPLEFFEQCRKEGDADLRSLAKHWPALTPENVFFGQRV